MIKRRFYRFEHGDKDVPSGTSSSSESEAEAEATDESEDDDEGNVVADMREKEEDSSSSGYESEDSSANEVNLDSSGIPTSDDDVSPQNGEQNIIGRFSTKEVHTLPTRAQLSPEKDEIRSELADCVLRCKSVFKCRLCPRIVCLSEETIKAHLISKRHARSEKLLKEGRLKLMLNEKGEIEGEDYPDNPHTAAVPGQKSDKSKKKGKERRKQKKRSRQEIKLEKARGPTENRKTRRKNNNS